MTTAAFTVGHRRQWLHLGDDGLVKDREGRGHYIASPRSAISHSVLNEINESNRSPLWAVCV